MRNIEKIALVGSVILFVCLVGNTWYGALLLSHSTPPMAKPSKEFMYMLNSFMLIRVSITLIIQIAVAAWMRRLAADVSLRPWLWSLFGFMFGLVAPVLFCFTQTAAMRRITISGGAR